MSGRARYTGDTHLADMLYAAIVPATRPHARITSLDLASASAAPGVIAIFTHRNTPKLASMSDYPLVGQAVLPSTSLMLTLIAINRKRSYPPPSRASDRLTYSTVSNSRTRPFGSRK